MRLGAAVLAGLAGCSLSTHFDDFTANERDAGTGGLEAGLDGAPRDGAADAPGPDAEPPDAGDGATVRVTVSGAGAGSVSSAPAGIDCDGAAGASCEATFAAPARVTLTAAADAASRFAGWSGACAGAESECVLDVTRGGVFDVAAAFEPATFALTVMIGGDGVGAVTSTDMAVSCAGTNGQTCVVDVPAGTEVTLDAAAMGEASFGGWSGACMGTGSCAVTLDADKTVGAAFDLNFLSVNIALPGGGNGITSSMPAGLDCGSGGECTASFRRGAAVVLRAVAAPDSTFEGWGGACAPAGRAMTCTLPPLVAAVQVSATFELRRYTITAERVGNGMALGAIRSTEPTGTIECPGGACAGTFPHGAQVTLIATAMTGAMFVGWSGVECVDPMATSCTFVVGADATVRASFTLRQYPVVFAKQGPGAPSSSISSSAIGLSCGPGCTTETIQVDHGATIVIDEVPGEGSTFMGWSGLCGGTATPCSTTVTGPGSVVANFVLESRSVLVMKAGDGMGTVASAPAGIDCGSSCFADFPYGQPVMLTATPAGTDTFAGWSGAGCAGTGPCVFSPTATTTTVTATFTRVALALIVSKNIDAAGTVTSAPGGISCGTDCQELYMPGQMVVLTAAPAPGYTFASWSGCMSVMGPTCNVTMSQTRNVTASFAPMMYPVTVSKMGTGDGTVTGSVGGIACGGTCTGMVAHGTNLTLTAAPNATSAFVSWGGPCAGNTTLTCAFDVTGGVTVPATFMSTARVLTVTVTPAGTGSVSSVPSGINCPGDCMEGYPNNELVTLTATPASNHEFTGWSGGGCTGTGTCQVTMSMAQSVTATFAPRRTLTVVPTPAALSAGAVVVSTSPDDTILCGSRCTATYTQGTTVHLQASEPDDGSYRFTGWSPNCAPTGPTTCSITLGTTNPTVNANFVRTYRLTVALAPSGQLHLTTPYVTGPPGFSCSVAGGCSILVTSGTTVTLQRAPPPLWATFAGWSATGCAPAATSCPVTVTADTTVTVTYPPRGNLAFVSSSTHVGGGLGFGFGGFGADNLCQGLAVGAGLPGTYAAFLTAQNQSANDRVDAIVRDEGWVRTDGLPFAASWRDVVLAGEVLHPLDRDEAGALRAGATVWTGALHDGSQDQNCGDWLNVNLDGTLGSTDFGTGGWTAYGREECGARRAIYCFGGMGWNGTLPPPPPPPVAGGVGYVWLSSGTFTPTMGDRAADMLCEAEAVTVDPPNATKYRALVALTTSAATEGATFNGQLRRRDGWPVADGMAFRAGTTRLATPITQDAGGAYVLHEPLWTSNMIWTGISSTPNVRPMNALVNTCADWNMNAPAGVTGVVAAPGAVATPTWYRSGPPASCSGAVVEPDGGVSTPNKRVLCFRAAP